MKVYGGIDLHSDNSVVGLTPSSCRPRYNSPPRGHGFHRSFTFDEPIDRLQPCEMTQLLKPIAQRLDGMLKGNGRTNS